MKEAFIEIKFINSNDIISLHIQRVLTSNITNSIYLYFESDAYARDTEEILKLHGYKTQHTDSCIRVMEFNSFDITFEI